MFGLLKDKLKSWITKSTDKLKGITKETLKEPEEPKRSLKKNEKSKGKKEKKQKKQTKTDIEKERQITEKIIEDIKKENLEIKTPEERVEELVEKKGFFKKLFSKSANKLTEEDFEQIYSDLELVLLENNVAYEVVEKIKADLKNQLVQKEIAKDKVEEEILNSLKKSIENILLVPFDFIKKIKEKEPFVILFFGINGSGKTTTIAKLAHLLKKNNLSSVLAAGDTFRAASIEQLSEHGRRLATEVIKSQYGADPASVAFDAIKHAQAKKIKVVLIDTAGRMHTKESLMKEMEKIVRVTKPDLKIFIAESITGNDAVEQAKIFNETVGIDGIILSKADVDEKGGTALSVSYVTGKPILFLGTGQEYSDLEIFDKNKIIKNLGL